MTSFRQIQANRRNALKSTGPSSEEGKQQSRRNAVRHGLTAETVIGALEDAEDYKAFEAAIIADYDAESAVERELVRKPTPSTAAVTDQAIRRPLADLVASNSTAVIRQAGPAGCQRFGRAHRSAMPADRRR